MKRLFTGLLAVLVAASFIAHGATAAESRDVGPDKVVYHISNAEPQTRLAMQYIRNHLGVNPKARIVVITYANGVDFLMDGAKDKNGNPYNIPVEELALRGVRFQVCEITLRERGLKRSQFIPEPSYVPSGVAEITRLQQRESYAYLRP